jgi:dTDP-4-dehydrorhamnose 3,5-epimerase
VSAPERGCPLPSGAMRRLETRIDGPVLVEPVVHADERGFFQETFRQDDVPGWGLAEDVAFVQDNHSRSQRGVVRGMHFQVGDGIVKLVRCARGTIVDVIVDVRRGSPHYGEWEAFELSDANHRQLVVPVGFAHGFCVISDVADVIYKQTGYYDPELERGIAYDDPDVGIQWPLGPGELVPSARDANAPRLRDIGPELPFVY